MNVTTRHFLGWDLGGAHLKLAGVMADGVVLCAEQVATPLWQGVKVLEEALRRMALPAGSPAMHGVTMTGELVDAFPDRQSGVQAILDAFVDRFPRDEVRVYTVGGLQPLAAARREPLTVASANWHASASFVARAAETGILMDVGTTTTDIVAFAEKRVCSLGTSDLERLQSGELVYTGVVRTPLMALASRAPFAGRWQNLAAELFATTADIYRVTGELDECCDMYPPADGGGKSREDSLRRLARMFGADFAAGRTDPEWLGAASFFAARQLELISGSLVTVRDRLPAAVAAPKLVGLGAGRFMIRKLAALHEMEYVDFEDLVRMDERARPLGAVCGSAVAVAQLARLETVQ